MPQPSVSRTTAKGHLVRQRDAVSKWEKGEEGWEDKEETMEKKTVFSVYDC